MERTEYSRRRLDELIAQLDPIEPLLADGGLCIYATGSYGRLEAWEGSDIDLFFLCEGHPQSRRFSNLAFIRIAAFMIEATERMDFPEFDRDGRFLDVQYVELMREILGSPEDDIENAFTARMLLLLESRPIYEEARYEEMLRTVIDFYYRDLAGHEADFLPTFLLNDILRFWRTLTLNYEHARYKIAGLDEDAQPEARANSALKNYKLKLSRLATCFSMVAHLASESAPILQPRVFELSQLTPRRRFEALRGQTEEADRHLDQIDEQYEGFLERVQRPDAHLLGDFRDRETRLMLLGDAARFGDEIFSLLRALTTEDRLRHLVV